MKRKVKKLLSLTLLLSLGMAGCGNQKEDVPSSISNSAPSSEKESSEPANSSKPADSSKPEESSIPEVSSISSPATSSSKTEDSSSLPPAKVEYDLTLTLAKGVEGHFEVDGAEATKAEKGKTVTIVISYDATKTKNITLTSHEVSLRKTDDTHYTFTMPERNVTVLVEGEHIPQSYKIASLKNYTGISSYSGYNKLLDSKDKEIKIGDEYKEGESVSLKFKSYSSTVSLDDSKNNFTLVLLVNGTEYPLTFAADPTSSSYYVMGTVSFVMPEEDVNLILVKKFKQADSSVSDTITFHCPAKEGYTLYNIEDGGVYSRDTVDSSGFFFFIEKQGGYTLTKVTYTTNVSSEAEDLTGSSEHGYRLPMQDSTVKNISIQIEGENVGTGDILIDGGMDGYSVDSPLTGITLGEEKELHFYPGSKKIATVKAKDAQGNDFPISARDNQKGYGYYIVKITLTKESGNVTLFITTVDSIPLTYQENDGIESVTFYSDYYNGNKISFAYPGDTVYVDVKEKDGYDLGDCYYTDTDKMREDDYSSMLCFTMPDDPSKLNIHFAVSQIFNIVFDNEDDTHFQIGGLRYHRDYAEGKEVSFSLTEKTGYVIEGVEVKDATGKVVALTKNDVKNGKYAFIMPSSNATVHVNGHIVATSKVTFAQKGGIDSIKVANAKGDSVSSGSLMNQGSEGQVQVKAAFGYNLKEVKIGDQTLSLVEGKTDTYAFTVPEGDFEITCVTEERAKQKLEITSEQADILKGYTVSDEGNNLSTEDGLNGYVGDNITIRPDYDDDSYTIDMDKTKVTDASGKSIEFSGYSQSIHFTMPESEVHVSLVFKDSGNRKITVDSTSYKVSTYSIPKKGKIGNEISFDIDYYGTSQYQMEIKTESGKEVSFKQTDAYDSTKEYSGNILGSKSVTITFTMPDEAVIITITEVK